ncbi:MAG: hypothetical protein P8Y70_10635 [Candidatus Lokiarchaeota archaeon]
MDMNNFQGKKVDDNLLHKADLVLVMQERHLKRLKRKFKNIPNLAEKSYIIKEFIDDEINIDIPDPVDFSDEDYRKTMKEVKRAVELSVKK